LFQVATLNLVDKHFSFSYLQETPSYTVILSAKKKFLEQTTLNTDISSLGYENRKQLTSSKAI